MLKEASHKIDERRIWQEDVRHMSYEDLMAAVRYLDQERQALANPTPDLLQNRQHKQHPEKNKAA